MLFQRLKDFLFGSHFPKYKLPVGQKKSPAEAGLLIFFKKGN
jgi:hypothetical protein